MHQFYKNSIGLVSLVLVGCNGGNTSDEQTPPTVDNPPPVTGNLPIPDNRYLDGYQVLLVGNSHVTANDLAQVLRGMLVKGTGKPVTSVVAPGWRYLDERLTDGVTRSTLQGNDWSHVIWQAQKYSTTGLYSYPTDASEHWIASSKQLGATPILFPEHPRQGNVEEGMRVYLLHKGIASREASCVAPVGPAWDAAIAAMPQVAMHSDGNHASIEGTFLTALLFYQVISGEVSESLPYMPEIKVAEQHQAVLRQIASEAIQQYGDCEY